MNEEFLSRVRKSPRPEFSRTLYKKLSQDAQALTMRRGSAGQRIGFALAALCLALILAFTVSPVVRAAVEDLIRKITLGGMTVLVNEEELNLAGEGATYSQIWKPSSPDTIASEYPFYAKFPTWVPAGYELQPQAALYYGSMYQEMPSSVLVEWRNARDDRIQLTVNKGSCPEGAPEIGSANFSQDCTMASYYSVGQESQPEVVSIKDGQGVLFRGVLGLAELWDTSYEWNPSRGSWNTRAEAGFTLQWENEGRTFVLVAASKTISREEFVRIAESIP